MFCAVFVALLGSALAGPIDFEPDLKHNVDPGRLQQDIATLDETLKNPASVEAEIELLKTAYDKTVIASPAPLNGSTSEDEDVNEFNENTGEEKDLFEGDIILTNDQRALIETSRKSNRARRQAIKYEHYLWGTVNPVIPYSYETDYPKEDREPIITAAMKFWEKHTCVRFKEVTVEIREADVCSSASGKIYNPAGTQALNLGKACMRVGVVTHELSHTFGFFHVQTRFDRDKYVEIDFDNAQMRGPFTIWKEDQTTLHDIPYEFGSNMHYSQMDSAIDSSKPVIRAKPAYKVYQGGEMKGRLPTFYDILAVNRHFNCAAKCNTSVTCAHDGVQDVNNCSKCLCPMGWAGDKCDQRPANTKTIIAKSVLEALTINMPAGNKTAEYKLEYYLFRAPEGMKVQITPKVLSASFSNACHLRGIEVKFLEDSRPAGLQVCNKREEPLTITSETNEMLVQAYSLGGQLVVDLEYEAVKHANYTGGQNFAKCETSVTCDNGGVQDVRNCNRCLCTLGWTGEKCSQRPANTKKIIAESEPNEMRIDMPKGKEYKVKYYLITAPTGMKVQMTPTILGGTWSADCNPMGIQVKFQQDQRAAGVRVCDFAAQPAITSETNAMLVQVYSLGRSDFAVELQYKAVY